MRWLSGPGSRAGWRRPPVPPYAGHRFPAEVISHAVWLYFRFPLELRLVEELLAARGIVVSHETVRQWARKFGQAFANRIRRRLPRPGDKGRLDEVVIKIAGVKHWLWRAVDQIGTVLDVLVQSRRDKSAAKRLLRKRQGRAPRVMITDKLASYSAAKREVMPVWRVAWTSPPDPEQVIAWSLWCRRHQQRARRCHWRRPTRHEPRL